MAAARFVVLVRLELPSLPTEPQSELPTPAEPDEQPARLQPRRAPPPSRAPAAMVAAAPGAAADLSLSHSIAPEEPLVASCCPSAVATAALQSAAEQVAPPVRSAPPVPLLPSKQRADTQPTPVETQSEAEAQAQARRAAEAEVEAKAEAGAAHRASHQMAAKRTRRRRAQRWARRRARRWGT